MVMNTQGNSHIIKSVGKVSALKSEVYIQTKNKDMTAFTSGIAHTRRATHGVANHTNTHPHTDDKQQFFVVHNGIIENHVKLKKQCAAQGYAFYSQTDTEVVPALLQIHRTGNLLETVEKVLPMLHGAYALLIMSSYTPHEMIAVKRGSPLILGTKENKNKNGESHSEIFFASDLQALA